MSVDVSGLTRDASAVAKMSKPAAVVILLCLGFGCCSVAGNNFTRVNVDFFVMSKCP